MNDHDLTELLERSADAVGVGAAPTEALLRRRSAVVRRRRRATALGAVLVSAGIAAALLVPLAPWKKDAEPAPKPVEPRTQSYGIGRLVVDVPGTWERNAYRCARPVADTVAVGHRMMEACWETPTRTYDSIEISHGPNRGWAKHQGSFLGERALLGPASCETFEIRETSPFAPKEVPPQPRSLTRCDAAVYFPVDEVLFRFESASKERIEEMLGWIRISTDEVGVPGYDPVDVQRNDDGLKYADQLRALGLDVTVVEKADRWGSAGDYLGSSVNVGTVLDRGAPVTVTVASPTPGVRGKVRIAFWTTAPDGGQTYAEDSALRRYIHRVAVDDGTVLKVLADGEYADRVTARITGGRLTPVTQPGAQLAWRASGPGRSAVHLSMTVDGKQIRLGTILIGIRD